MMKRLLLPIVTLALACAAAPPPAPTAPASGSIAPASAVRNPEFRNVQLLSHEMSRDQLIEVMRRFTQALGVGCDHCHVVTATTPEMQFDFPADQKKYKQVARVMIQMVQQVNGPWMERVEAAEGHPPSAEEGASAEGPMVGCWTCHRGKAEPEMPPPLPPRKR